MPKAYHHLTQEQRWQIYTLKKRGFSQRVIGSEAGVAQSSVSRELRRNKVLDDYHPQQAQECAARRGLAGRCVARVMTASLIARVEDLLIGQQWSPQQISGKLRLEDGTKVSHESLYRHIWADKRAGGTLYQHLRQQGKKHNKRGGKNAGRGLIPGRVDIAERPAIVAEKIRLGDWELDSIIGAKHRGAIVSMVERKSKLTRLVLQAGPTAEATCKSIISRLLCMKEQVLTLTSDNGKEFAHHQKISEILGAEFYFATPYHSWERGLNENTNGLVRQYFPKGMDFATLTHAEVQRVEDLLNNRPRKTLGYLSPNEVFAKLTASNDDALQM